MGGPTALRGAQSTSMQVHRSWPRAGLAEKTGLWLGKQAATPRQTGDGESRLAGGPGKRKLLESTTRVTGNRCHTEAVSAGHTWEPQTVFSLYSLRPRVLVCESNRCSNTDADDINMCVL